MSDRIVNLVGILAETIIKVAERPGCLALWVYRLGNLADVTHDLCIAPQVGDELGIGGCPKPLANGTKNCFSWRSGFLNALIPREQGVEVRGFEFGATVHDDDLWEATMQSNALPQDHHARAITWRIEGDVYRQDTTTVCIRKEREPRSAKASIGPRRG